MSVVAVVQARMGSSRLPGKVLQDIEGRALIEVLLTRLADAQSLDQIVVATSVAPENDALCAHLEGMGQAYHRGSETDVLARYCGAAREAKASTVVRITGDCPLVDPQMVDAVVTAHIAQAADYTSNCVPPAVPDGLDVEVFPVSALFAAQEKATEMFDREHVTPFIKRAAQTSHAVHTESDHSAVRWSVDEVADLEVVRNIFGHFSPSIKFGWEDVIALMSEKPALFDANKSIANNEGATMGQGQKLWKRAKAIIPGGNMLLSKRSEMHLPTHWPSYFSKTKGCQVWDLDGNQFTDMYLMGVGTNILGYAHPEVDAAVMQVVQSGNLSTLNAPEEVYLAEKLIELDPWAGMVRFARTGGEANAVAIRIARAASGKDGVAVCGYHGWHDWYLSANLGDDNNLAGHLMPGLSPEGVPQALKGMVHAFNYNDFARLETLVKEQNIGVIKMEVMRTEAPKNDFLARVRKLASDNGIVLIFDECTSGFRETFGGLHKKFGVEPDIAVYGKTIGNGYAATAVVGRKEVMNAAQATFISSTFWTERIGAAAALKTLEVMEREKPWEHATKMGEHLRDRWALLAQKYDLEIAFAGLAALSGFSFNGLDPLLAKTFITQEMLKKNYLAGTACYVSHAHTQEIVDEYIDALDPILGRLSSNRQDSDLEKLLDGPVCHGGFRRIN